MSGICGLLRLDGGPAPSVEAMAARLARRGPDGTRLWAEGPVALGHALLATTPEARHEALPLTHPETGCTITADARLDNRDELIDALGLDARVRVVGDGELLLRAWLAWGEGCLDRLLGDYAFAVWDPRAPRLWTARDPMGMRALAYAHVPGRLLAFATEPRAMLEVPGVPHRIDAGRIADFLEGYLEALDHEATFYEGVHRLPPGHVLTADARGVATRRAWTLAPGEPLRLPSAEAYAEGFREAFTAAVRSRLRSDGPVGCALSGGVDSGSVAAVASRLLAAEGRGPLHVVSVIDARPPGDPETRAIRASLTLPGLRPHLVDLHGLEPWADALRDALLDLDEPFDGRSNLLRAAYLAARRAGLRVVLDGGSGDNALHEGPWLAHLLGRGRWGRAWDEAAAEERLWDDPGLRWRHLQEAAALAFEPDVFRHLRHAWARARHDRPTGPLLSPAFAREVGLAGRVERWRRANAARRGTLAEIRAALIARPRRVVGTERYGRLAGALGIEPRDPFLDLRVVRFCLRCPPEQLRANGWAKVLLRRAMRGLLPAEVLWRPGRTHHGYALTAALLGDAPPAPLAAALARGRGSALLGAALRPASGQDGSEPLRAQHRWDRDCLALWLASSSSGLS